MILSNVAIKNRTTVAVLSVLIILFGAAFNAAVASSR